MRHLILLLATGLSLVLIPAILPGQTLKIPTDTTQLVSVSTVDGNEFVGQILKIEAEAIVLKTENLGALRLRKQDIKTIKPVSRKQFVGGEYWFENPHSTRYFFGPNGYGLRKGEGYYQNTWIFFNQVNYGITDNFSMGVGIMPLFLIGGEASPVWVTPKVSLPVKKDKVNLGFGGIFYYLLGGDGETLGIAYGQATFGSRDKNVNIGVGYGVADGEWASAPTLSLSGFYRVGKNR